MKHIVLCPGSRSGPLALAAGSVSKRYGLSLHTSIDERSAAFLALGISAASGNAVGVITTSGSAVANLLPAAVEADRSCHPILFLTADRPRRLKECGANQAVNQEDFLKSVCRHFEESPRDGVHLMSQERLKYLVDKTWEMITKVPGPVHINLHYEEPLLPTLIDQQKVLERLEVDEFLKNNNNEISKSSKQSFTEEFSLIDPFRAGIIIIGPWRGKPKDLIPFRKALKKWQDLSGWPIFADPLSGISSDQKGLIYHWELLLSAGYFNSIKEIQVLRLGPLPSSRKLQSWIKKLGEIQLLITEGDNRNLDPIGNTVQFSSGFSCWLRKFIEIISKKKEIQMKTKSVIFTSKTIQYDLLVSDWIDKELMKLEGVTEPSLARCLPLLLPTSIPVMLASSSPIRDWMTYSGIGAFTRRCYGFRGASGIDGTLSLGMGLSIVLGKMVLVTGDLALFHDTNGWLFSKNKNTNLIVIMIDNAGGGIFNQLNIDQIQEGDFEEIFIMPQQVCPLTLAQAYGVQYRQVASLQDLEMAIEWSLSLSTNVLIRVCTKSYEDHKLRVSLRDDLKRKLSEVASKLVNEI